MAPATRGRSGSRTPFAFALGVPLVLLGLLLAGLPSAFLPSPSLNGPGHATPVSAPSESSDRLAEAFASLAVGAGPASGHAWSCQGNELGSASCGLQRPSSSTSPAATVLSWQNITGSAGVPPSARIGSAIAYDVSDGYVLLFGGENGAGTNLYSDTWKFVGGGWSNITTSVGSPPFSRVTAAMTYDYADKYVVLFGGLAVKSGSYLDDRADTWTFHGGTWSNITTTAGTAPTARFSAAMAYDFPDHEVIMFGGEDVVQGTLSVTINMLSDTWAFSGGTWKDLTSTAGTPPSPRAGSEVAFDPVDGYVLLYGGIWNTLSGTTITGYVIADTWKFTGGHWSNITASVHGSPGDRALGGLAYDPGADVMVLAGGCYAYVSQACSLENSTWAYTGGTWTDASATMSVAPPPRGTMAMINDTADGYIVFFGGSCGNGCAQQDTWREPAPPSSLPSVQFEVAPAAACGPVSFNGLAEVSGSSVSAPLGHDSLSVPACPEHPFGSWNVSGGLSVGSSTTSSTTLAIGGSGTLTAYFLPSLGVSLSANATVVALGAHVRLTAAGWGGLPPYSDVWSLNGTNTSSTGSSLALVLPDAANYTYQVWETDSAAQVVGSAPVTIEVLPFVAPPLSVNVTLTSYDTPTGYPLTASAHTSGGTIDSYVWTENGSAALSCSTANCSVTFAHGARYTLGVQVTDSRGRTAAATSGVTVYGYFPSSPPGALDVTLSANATTTTVGGQLTLTTSVSGGIPPYNFYQVHTSLDGADEGNSSFVTNGAVLEWNFTTAGTVTLIMWVTDSASEVAASAPLTIDVKPVPTGSSSTGAGGLLGLSDLDLAILGAIVAALLLGVLLALRARRTRARPPESPPPLPPAAAWSPPPTRTAAVAGSRPPLQVPNDPEPEPPWGRRS